MTCTNVGLTSSVAHFERRWVWEEGFLADGISDGDDGRPDGLVRCLHCLSSQVGMLLSVWMDRARSTSSVQPQQHCHTYVPSM